METPGAFQLSAENMAYSNCCISSFPPSKMVPGPGFGFVLASSSVSCCRKYSCLVWKDEHQLRHSSLWSLNFSRPPGRFVRVTVFQRRFSRATGRDALHLCFPRSSLTAILCAFDHTDAPWKRQFRCYLAIRICRSPFLIGCKILSQYGFLEEDNFVSSSNHVGLLEEIFTDTVRLGNDGMLQMPLYNSCSGQNLIRPTQPYFGPS